MLKGLELASSPQQDEFRNFCMSNETEEIYQKLEKIISIN